MPCYHPLHGYRSKHVNPSGKRSIVFSRELGYVDMPMTAACGQCIGCRLERSRQWATRCVHEASLHENNCFITLTYEDQFLPLSETHGLPEVRKRDFQLFMKRLRERFYPGIRVAYCGEYGELLNRPHFHALLFNIDFPDKYLWSNKRGVRLCRSPTLEELWYQGQSVIGDVTFESAAYVARYILKKINGDEKEDHYLGREPEFFETSRKPGLARTWIERYYSDVYTSDSVVVRGDIIVRPPRYYDAIYDILNPEHLKEIKSARKANAVNNPDSSADRLAARKRVQELKADKLKRGLESVR